VFTGKEPESDSASAFCTASHREFLRKKFLRKPFAVNNAGKQEKTRGIKLYTVFRPGNQN
jgi:hypothetical protein